LIEERADANAGLQGRDNRIAGCLAPHNA